MIDVAGLAVPGSWVVTSRVFSDDRGAFLEWFRPDQFEAETGKQFRVAQANESISRRGVVRGIHFADVPPGQSKWVHCTAGAVLDVVVDIRVGSPTFGRSDAVVLDAAEHRSVVISEGLGHGFCALTDEAAVSYLLSDVYRPDAEHGIDPQDHELAIEWPFPAAELILSAKDAAAPTLAEAAASGLLPRWPADAG